MDKNEEQAWREYGRWIEDKRVAERLSQEGAAGKAGISRQTWIYITRGNRTKRATVIKMARAVNADIDEALRRTGFAPLPGDHTQTEAKQNGYHPDTEQIIARAEDMPPETRYQLLVISEALWKDAKQREEAGKKKRRA